MDEPQTASPDSTTTRVVLWCVLHMHSDAPPHVLGDAVGLKLLAPEPGWQQRDGMDPQFTRPSRASIVACVHFIEDPVIKQAGRGLLSQYVILGAGLDSSAQRRPDMASRMTMFKVDQPGPQAWKRQRLQALGFGIPCWLHFMPVDFEARESWQDTLVAAGSDTRRPVIMVSTSVNVCLSKEANTATLRQVVSLVPGSMLAMTFLLPLEMADPDVRPGLEMAEKGACANGTPFISFFTPPEMPTLTRENSFRDAQHISVDTLTERYFSGRTDGLRPSRSAEELLLTMV